MQNKLKTEVAIGTLRLGKDLKFYEKTKTGWKKSQKQIPETINTIKLFKAHHTFKELIDKKNPQFLKGQLSPDNNVRGARINILPDGKKLDKAYSILAKNLTIHGESSHDHWDVIYQNPNGKYAYLYTQEKKNKAVKKKYQTVKEFEKKYPIIQKNVLNALKDKNDVLAVPVYTLLKTYMRIGNEIYYKAHGHKGLTTLKKKDILINKNNVTFSYLGKNGVPEKITESFPELYIQRLKEITNPIKINDFIFIDKNTGHPLHDTHFKEAFKKYCGQEFYPHIVRSYYATSTAEKFLKNKKSASKQEVKDLYNSIAEKLGHKRFNKKENQWKDNYNVTIHYYIQPNLVEKINSMIK